MTVDPLTEADNAGIIAYSRFAGIVAGRSRAASPRRRGVDVKALSYPRRHGMRSPARRSPGHLPRRFSWQPPWETPWQPRWLSPWRPSLGGSTPWLPSTPRLAILTAVAIVATVGVSVVPAHAATTNLALGALATATSSENAGLGPDKAIDGDPATRWSSAFSDPQALTVDLGARAHITGVTLRWEAAFATAYRVETSPDGSAWTPVHEESAADGGVDEITGLDVTARYARMTGTARATPYGYSLFEFEVYGEFVEQAVSIGVGARRLRGSGRNADVPGRRDSQGCHAVRCGRWFPRVIGDVHACTV